eukprot:TRINITY_DN47298_c0_g1_i1.p1 TRINITY_DN47298_c0_g1~~TRINITY_DN47298_c0_g1_i1.p1  ORF type:complete len:404 (-),score=114.01 TRINITY_DN47298_c0_g1_i1:337-1548(-)
MSESKKRSSYTFSLANDEAESFVSFPNGAPNSQYLQEAPSKMRFVETVEGNRKRLFSAAGKTEYNGYAERETTSQTYVGKIDEATKTIQLIKVNHFPMKQVLTGGGSVLENKNKDLGFYEARKQLTASFGALKNQREIKAMEANVIEAKNVRGMNFIEGSIRSAADQHQVVAKRAAEKANKKALYSLLPRFNLEATKIEEAYSMDSFMALNEGELEQMSEQYEEMVIAAQDKDALDILRKEHKYGYLVMAILEKLASTEGVSLSKIQSQVQKLLILHTLFAFSGMRRIRSDKAEDDAEKFKTGAYLMQRLSIAVFGKGQRGRPIHVREQLKDRLVLHCIIASCLVMDDSSVNLRNLSRDLKTDVKSLKEKCRFCGCLVTDASARLTIPLKLQGVEQGRKRFGQ